VLRFVILVVGIGVDRVDDVVDALVTEGIRLGELGANDERVELSEIFRGGEGLLGNVVATVGR